MKISVSLSFHIREIHGPLLTCCFQEQYFLASGFFKLPKKKSPHFNTVSSKHTVCLHHKTITKESYFCMFAKPEIKLQQNARFVEDFKMLNIASF